MCLFLCTWFSFFFCCLISLWILFLHSHVYWEVVYRLFVGMLWKSRGKWNLQQRCASFTFSVKYRWKKIWVEEKTKGVRLSMHWLNSHWHFDCWRHGWSLSMVRLASGASIHECPVSIFLKDAYSSMDLFIKG